MRRFFCEESANVTPLRTCVELVPVLRAVRPQFFCSKTKCFKQLHFAQQHAVSAQPPVLQRTPLMLLQPQRNHF